MEYRKGAYWYSHSWSATEAFQAKAQSVSSPAAKSEIKIGSTNFKQKHNSGPHDLLFQKLNEQRKVPAETQ